MPTGVGVAGRRTRSTPSTTSTSTATGGGLIACVAASDSDVRIGWSVRCSEKQNDALVDDLAVDLGEVVEPVADDQRLEDVVLVGHDVVVRPPADQLLARAPAPDSVVAGGRRRGRWSPVRRRWFGGRLVRWSGGSSRMSSALIAITPAPGDQTGEDDGSGTRSTHGATVLPHLWRRTSIAAAGMACSEPAAVDEEALRGAATAVVGGEEEDHLDELVGCDPLLERLIAHRLLLTLG